MGEWWEERLDEASMTAGYRKGSGSATMGLTRREVTQMIADATVDPSLVDCERSDPMLESAIKKMAAQRRIAAYGFLLNMCRDHQDTDGTKLTAMELAVERTPLGSEQPTTDQLKEEAGQWGCELLEAMEWQHTAQERQQQVQEAHQLRREGGPPVSVNAEGQRQPQKERPRREPRPLRAAEDVERELDLAVQRELDSRGGSVSTEHDEDTMSGPLSIACAGVEDGWTEDGCMEVQKGQIVGFIPAAEADRIQDVVKVVRTRAKGMTLVARELIMTGELITECGPRYWQALRHDLGDEFNFRGRTVKPQSRTDGRVGLEAHCIFAVCEPGPSQRVNAIAWYEDETIKLFAASPIGAGEEIVVYYGTEYNGVRTWDISETARQDHIRLMQELCKFRRDAEIARRKDMEERQLKKNVSGQPQQQAAADGSERLDTSRSGGSEASGTGGGGNTGERQGTNPAQGTGAAMGSGGSQSPGGQSQGSGWHSRHSGGNQSKNSGGGYKGYKAGVGKTPQCPNGIETMQETQCKHIVEERIADIEGGMNNTEGVIIAMDRAYAELSIRYGHGPSMYYVVGRFYQTLRSQTKISPQAREVCTEILVRVADLIGMDTRGMSGWRKSREGEEPGQLADELDWETVMDEMCQEWKATSWKAHLDGQMLEFKMGRGETTLEHRGRFRDLISKYPEKDCPTDKDQVEMYIRSLPEEHHGHVRRSLERNIKANGGVVGSRMSMAIECVTNSFITSQYDTGAWQGQTSRFGPRRGPRGGEEAAWRDDEDNVCAPLMGEDSRVRSVCQHCKDNNRSHTHDSLTCWSVTNTGSQMPMESRVAYASTQILRVLCESGTHNGDAIEVAFVETATRYSKKDEEHGRTLAKAFLALVAKHTDGGNITCCKDKECCIFNTTGTINFPELVKRPCQANKQLQSMMLRIAEKIRNGTGGTIAVISSEDADAIQALCALELITEGMYGHLPTRP